MPDGLIHHRKTSSHELSVMKVDAQLRLIFSLGRSGEIQSRLDLNEPLNLVSPYTQAMMLGLAWQSSPEKIHIIGFGGGRIPMVIHTYFPEVQIDCTETDQDVVEVAQEFFGVALDARLRVFLQDGRRFLQELGGHVQYDMIMVDAFDGTGSSPLPLSTKEFYSECMKHLTDEGLVIVNLLLNDEQYYDKVKTLAACFRHVWAVSTGDWGGAIYFASRADAISKPAIVAKVRQLEELHNFSFPLVDHAKRLAPVNEFIRLSRRGDVLVDSGR